MGARVILTALVLLALAPASAVASPAIAGSVALGFDPAKKRDGDRQGCATAKRRTQLRGGL
jgi:hypothetical protein